MRDPIKLTDAEIAAVAGGDLAFQSIDIDARQSNRADVDQRATATNFGTVNALGGGSNSTTVAVGALASNTSLISQLNSIRATNVARF